MIGFAAAVFDLNGTLVDDLAYHFCAWRELGARLGKTLDGAFLQSINGLKPRWPGCGHERWRARRRRRTA